MVIPSKKRGFLRGKSSKKTSCCETKTTKHISEEKLNQMIRERAYFLWLEQGRPQGQDHNNWVRAEREIKRKGIC